MLTPGGMTVPCWKPGRWCSWSPHRRTRGFGSPKLTPTCGGAAMPSMRSKRSALPNLGVVRLSRVAVIYGMVGERDKAQALLQEVLARSRERYVYPALIATVYAATGDSNRALEYFDRSINDRSLVASWLRAPELDNIRSDPRYKALFSRLGLKP